MRQLFNRGLARALSREIIHIVQIATRSTMAFCVIVEAGATDRVATGWLAIDGSIEPICDRHISLLLPEALRDGTRVSDVELVDGYDQLLVSSFDVQSARMCTGVARRRDAPPFDPIDSCRLHGLVPVASQLAALHARCLEHARRELVQRSLRCMTHACCVLDLDTRRIRWFHEANDNQSCFQTILHNEDHFIDLVERLHGMAFDDEQRLRIATIGRTRVVRTVDLGRAEEFDTSSSLAVALVSTAAAPTKLSTREREIAQLLATGYSTVNAAAMLSLSENTIRTYVRRLYRKLEITNRADLTRKCSELYLC
ncbi:MAG TPA: helix-turn-helix transcriptional regulator [Kofleriaceae bacterium]|jgi:DNA-binding CsgD family transcriptional regulator|nr:helix-turn-helix transcriptional regulator [Kofleriaceae bacterium]